MVKIISFLLGLQRGGLLWSLLAQPDGVLRRLAKSLLRIGSFRRKRQIPAIPPDPSQTRRIRN